MLNSLYINNFRNLKDLEVKNLGRINLITGKNNTGKSSILEAVAIYAGGGDLDFIFQLLEERGEVFSIKNDALESNTKSLASIFPDRVINYDSNFSIYIGNLITDSNDLKKIDKVRLAIRFVKFNRYNAITGDLRYNSHIMTYDDFKPVGDSVPGLEITTNDKSFIIPIDKESPRKLLPNQDIQRDDFQYIRSWNINADINASLFDRIALTDKENVVIEALKIIVPATERIGFIEEAFGVRSAVIKLAGLKTVLPLRSMGDGINRILTIILAMVNADNGYLLIDEFENGLHYSVQTKLWEIIFNLAEKLNIQVFATTHSNDCIESFSEVLNSRIDPSEGTLIRLDNINGVIKPVVFSADELQIANDQSIETR